MIRSVLAGDLGGTKCRIALVGEDFQVAGVQRFATVRERTRFLADLDAAIAAARAALPEGWQAPAAIGIGTAGVIPPDGRSIHYAPNLPLDGLPLADRLREQHRLPATLINDGRASAVGEWRRGHARGADPLLCLFFGTGIGIGLVVGGRPYGGADNAAGEIGHTTFRPGGRRCPCGRDGHFEAYCGGRAISEQAETRLGPRADGRLWNVADLLAHDGAEARAILGEAAEAALAMTANACTLLNPRAVVLGGGVLDGWPALRTMIEQHVRQACSVPIAEHLRFVPTLGGSDAILWGAASVTGALWA